MQKLLELDIQKFGDGSGDGGTPNPSQGTESVVTQGTPAPSVEPTPAPQSTSSNDGVNDNQSNIIMTLLDKLLPSKDNTLVNEPATPASDNEGDTPVIDKASIAKTVHLLSNVDDKYVDFVLSKVSGGEDIEAYLKDNPQYMKTGQSNELESKVDEKFKDFVSFAIGGDMSKLDEYLNTNPQYAKKNAPTNVSTNMGGGKDGQKGVYLSANEMALLKQVKG